jgi:hypothetical protein
VRRIPQLDPRRAVSIMFRPCLFHDSMVEILVIGNPKRLKALARRLDLNGRDSISAAFWTAHRERISTIACDHIGAHPPHVPARIEVFSDRAVERISTIRARASKAEWCSQVGPFRRRNLPRLR